MKKHFELFEKQDNAFWYVGVVVEALVTDITIHIGERKEMR